jgi:hypothetical protein
MVFGADEGGLLSFCEKGEALLPMSASMLSIARGLFRYDREKTV